MPKTIKIASWNIAGGHTIGSLNQFDYQPEDVAYFASQLKLIDADILCIQETHINASRSITKDIAVELKYDNIYDVDVSPSHIDDNYHLGNSIISKFELQHIKDAYYPYPEFELRFPNGQIATGHHDKMAQMFTYDGFMICNTQMLPLELFGHSYVDGPGKLLAEEIEDILLKELSSPLVFCGDFNFNAPSEAYHSLFKELGLRDVLPSGVTRPNLQGRYASPDHILVTGQFECIDSKIIEVNADHYLCTTTLKY